MALALALALSGRAFAADDPYQLIEALPAPPATLEAAKAATVVGATLQVTPDVALNAKITAAIASAGVPSGSVGGFDIARARSDPAYAAAMQARLQSMSEAEKMALVQAMSAQARARATDPGAGAAAAFMAGQRPADQAAQQKIRALLDGALSAQGALHKGIDRELDAAAKACPADKTGWPLATCTDALGEKSIARHRATEAAGLPAELKAYAEARAIALAEVNKGRDLLARARGAAEAGPMTAWVATYAQLLGDYGAAITLRAAFWARATGHKYTGSVTAFIVGPENIEIHWPLTDPAAARTGL